MANRILTKLPTPEGVAAGSTATFRVPTGRRILAFYLTWTGGSTVSSLQEIRISCNSQIIQRFSGTERATLNTARNRPDGANMLEIPFVRYGLKTMLGEEESALNTASPDKQGMAIRTVTVEIDLSSTSSITQGGFAMYALETERIPGGAGTIPYINKDIRSPSGASDNYAISDLVNPAQNDPTKVALRSVYFNPSTGTVDHLKIERNNYMLYDAPLSINNTLMSKSNTMTPPNAGYLMDTHLNGYGGNVITLTGMTDFRYVLDVSAASNITVISEYLGSLVG